jgi:hypothetical protein
MYQVELGKDNHLSLISMLLLMQYHYLRNCVNIYDDRNERRSGSCRTMSYREDEDDDYNNSTFPYPTYHN